MRSAGRLLVLGLVAFAGTARAQGPSLDPELDAGIRLVDEGNFEAGIAKLDGVARRLKAAGDKPLQLSRAYLYLGIAHLQLSQEQAARARFAEAARTDRNLELSSYEFPPPVVRLFEEAKRATREAAAEATPAPAPTPPPAAAQPGPPPARRLPAGPFLDAARSGDLATVKRMLEQDPALVSARDDSFGATALHWAAQRGHAAVAAQLIVAGADLGARNREGETPQQVALRAKRAELARILRPRAAPAPAEARRDMTPATAPAADGASVFDAAKTGDAARIQALLSATPDLVWLHDTAFGATPLHWAAQRGQLDAARVLLERGADVSAVNNDGETALEVAHRGQHREVETLLAQASKQPKVRFFEAVRRGDAGAVKKLLEREPGLIAERDTSFGATALHWAALRGHVDVIEVLLSRGAAATAVNAAGETPLDVAIRARRDKVVRALSR